ncbi:hypothetical protein ACRBEF_10400 [Yersinia proxima]|uniref:hypothetical protein n=1 Tax=Yersinia proxima TaxID=2890316 RepID=UPI003D683E4C
MNNNISFSERIIKLPSGFSLIWPFRNVSKSVGPYELFIDNNALVTSRWFTELEASIKIKTVLSPSHALSEQWLSNPLFRDNAVERIKKFLTPFVNEGVLFESGYAEKCAHLLKMNEKESRSQWMIIYLYVVLLYRIVSSKKDDIHPKQLLMELNQIDVPRFNGCIMLCTLAGYLKENKTIKLIGDNKTAFSYIASFIDLHTRNKNESNVDERYLRNRVGDLSMWLYLPMLMQHGYKKAGELVVVTQDNVLKNFVFRCFPGVLIEDGQMAFSFDERSFESNHSENIMKRILANTNISFQPVDRKKQLEKLSRLKTHVIEGAEAALIAEVDKVWDEWLVPGFFDSFTI